MSNITTATVVVSVGQTIEQTEVQAIKNACEVFEVFDGHSSFYTDVEADTGQHNKVVVPLDSAAGEERVVEQLEKTTEKRVKNLEEVLELVEEAGSVEAAAQNRDLLVPARRLGVDHQPQAAFLYDEAYLTGDPIINREHLDRIAERYDGDDEDLYLVDVKLEY